MSAEDVPVSAVPVLCCRGCGAIVEPAEPFPFRCPNAGEGDVDHLLERRFEPGSVSCAAEIFERGDDNPFIRYRELLHSWQAAREMGLDDRSWCEIVETLDAMVAEVDGRGFRTTPFRPVPALAGELGVGSVWLKNESGNVSGSHKGRHLMGVMLWLEAACRLGLFEGDLPPLAIASCGNAALAAAVVARAARRRLEVFVPTHANPVVLEQLTSLGARLHACPRIEGEAGDPCYLRFREALAEGAVPFTCQGNENGLTPDGGKTLVWEMVSSLVESRAEVDRILLHVGGGALASSVIHGLREARELGALGLLPIIHAVQTTGAWPLVRAHRLLVERILGRWAADSSAAIPEGDGRRAALLATPELESYVRDSLVYAVANRSEFMWPWEEEPHSIADGILDDETYDWVAVVEGMLETGGWPVVVSEETLVAANDLAREAAGLHPCHTGTAGLAGAMALADTGVLRSDETIALIVSGVERPS